MQIVANNLGNALVPDLTGDVQAADNRTPRHRLIFEQDPAPGTIVTVGTHVVTVTVTDLRGNSTECHRTLEVVSLVSQEPVNILDPEEATGTVVELDVEAETAFDGSYVTLTWTFPDGVDASSTVFIQRDGLLIATATGTTYTDTTVESGESYVYLVTVSTLAGGTTTQCCIFPPGTTVFSNTAQTATVSCPVGTTGDSETVTVPANTFTSSSSQADADALALASATAQATALLCCCEDCLTLYDDCFPYGYGFEDCFELYGDCYPYGYGYDIHWNVYQSYAYECPECSIGDDVTVVIPAGKYAAATQADADAAAVAVMMAQVLAQIDCTDADTRNCDLLGYWKLDNNGHEVLHRYDLSNTASETFTTGIIAQGLNVVAASQSLFWPDSVGLPLALVATDFTVRCWFNVSAMPVGGRVMMVSKGVDFPFLRGGWELGILDQDLNGTADAISVYVRNPSTGSTQLPAVAAITHNVWHHVVWTYTWLSKRSDVWLDGVQILTNGLHAHDIGQDAEDFRIGSQTGGTFVVDEVGIWSFLWDQALVTQDYNGGVGETWPFGA